MYKCSFFRNLWLSIVLAVPTVIILFVLTNISYFTAMNRAELLSSDAVAVVCSLDEQIRVYMMIINRFLLDMG